MLAKVAAALEESVGSADKCDFDTLTNAAVPNKKRKTIDNNSQFRALSDTMSEMGHMAA